MDNNFINTFSKKIVLQQLANIKEGHLILNLPDQKQYVFGNANDFNNIMYIKQ